MRRGCGRGWGALPLWVAAWLPVLAFAQTDPFVRGATALQDTLFTWLTPIAIIAVMILGGAAMAGRISWGWAVGLILGIAIAFGAPQIVPWIRALFQT